MLTRAREVSLKFNAKKCKTKQDEVPCVGDVLRKDGLKPDPKRYKGGKRNETP